MKKAEYDSGQVYWEAPSNIALVKYWGKKSTQIPCNPSISFSLSSSKTRTSLKWRKRDHGGKDFSFDFFFEDKKNQTFEKKIQTFLERIEPNFSFLRDYHLEFYSSNTFPHSVGIASSASSMASIALCLCSMAEAIGEVNFEKKFFQEASSIARLGSGSACRSLYGGAVSWGEHSWCQRELGSDLYATPFSGLHPKFKGLLDFILLVDSSPKKVSSTAGHSLMNDHPFLDSRISQANHNMEGILKALDKGDWMSFQHIVENEALTLHSLMMSSSTPFILMKPQSLILIEKIREFRKKSGAKCCFTLDAGPNLHLLCLQDDEALVRRFIKEDLEEFLENKKWIADRMGFDGPKGGYL